MPSGELDILSLNFTRIDLIVVTRTDGVDEEGRLGTFDFAVLDATFYTPIGNPSTSSSFRAAAIDFTAYRMNHLRAVVVDRCYFRAPSKRYCSELSHGTSAKPNCPRCICDKAAILSAVRPTSVAAFSKWRQGRGFAEPQEAPSHACRFLGLVHLNELSVHVMKSTNSVDDCSVCRLNRS